MIIVLVLIKWRPTSDGQGAADQLGSVLVGGFTLVVGGVFQLGGGEYEEECGGGGVCPL